MKKYIVFDVSIERVNKMFRIFKQGKLEYFINAIFKVFEKKHLFGSPL